MLGNGAYIAKSINYHSYTKQSSPGEKSKVSLASVHKEGVKGKSWEKEMIFILLPLISYDIHLTLG